MNAKTHSIIFKSPTSIRIDKYLADNFPEVSRSQFQRIIREGNVEVDGQKIKKTGYLLEKIGLSIRFSIPEAIPLDLKPENIPLDIIFENKDVLVVNKTAGMVVHPSAGHSEGTLVHAALGYFSFPDGIGGKLRPGIVHRLDKNTSGVIILAKNEKAHVWLQKQFKSRKTIKIYRAMVDKHPPTDSGKINAPIYRDKLNRKKMAIAPEGKGKAAITIYRTLKKFNKLSYLELQLLTGRTHQIRVHLASIGSPITGDTVYGYSSPTLKINRHFLHAQKLEICLPGNIEKSVFEAKLPKELAEIIENLKIREK